MLPFVIRGATFIAVFVALQLCWQGVRGTAVERLVVHAGVVRPAAYAVNRITPRVHAGAEGSILRAPGGSLNVRNGCEGTEALFLLIAALSAAPLSWRARALGLLYGLPFVYLLNQARVVVLFYAYRANPASFDLLHGSVTPIALVLAVAVYFHAWLAHSVRSTASAH
jgi:exosortase/archaeosortase family protein